MSENLTKNLYYHKECKMYLRLIKTRETNINTYLEVDATNNPTIEKRGWSVHPTEQRRLVTGFDRLELIGNKQDLQLF